MPRPNTISNKDVERWNMAIQSDKSIPSSYKVMPNILEVCYAGSWLYEELEKVHCPEDIIVRIQYTAGKLSFGRDPWEVHSMLLEKYNLNELEFAEDEDTPQITN